MYYTILIAFDIRYLAFFALNILSLFLDLLAPLIVFLYALNIKSSVRFWQVLFFVRIFFDLTGHHYDLQLIRSGFYQNTTYGLVCLGIVFLPFLPSYLAHYLYAFKKTQSSA
jgi:hypothetical protein